MYREGLVVGKFYPPHLGHKYLIDTALENCRHVTVIVCGKKEETIDPELRGEWLRKIHPKATVMVIEDIYGEDDNSKLWANLTLQWLGFRPDAVFTSEDYGHDYARFLGCKHIQVDKERKKFPISGTKVRQDPFRSWEFLEPIVRSHFVKRICLVGAESTGKTTLSRDLAESLKTVWVPEYGRFYWEARLPQKELFKWGEEDFVKIAEMQNKLEDELALEANKYLISDTNSFATGIWHERYNGFWSKNVESVSSGRKYDLYILPDVKTPFEDDGTRDSEHLRDWMWGRFYEELKGRGEKFIILSGTREERLGKALDSIQELCSIGQ